MRDATILTYAKPTPELVDALEVAAAVLGVEICWYYRGGFHFKVNDDWTVAIGPETAGRVRVETWERLRRRDTKWAVSGDCNRVAVLVREAIDFVCSAA